MMPAKAIIPIMLVAVNCAAQQRVAGHHPNQREWNRAP